MKNKVSNILLKGFVLLAISQPVFAQEAASDMINKDGGLIDQIFSAGGLFLAAMFVAGLSFIGLGVVYYINNADNPQEKSPFAKMLRMTIGGGVLTIIPLIALIIVLTLGANDSSSSAVTNQLNQIQQ